MGGGTDTEIRDSQKVDTGEENSPAAPAGTRTRDLSITSPSLILADFSPHTAMQRVTFDSSLGVYICW